MSDQIPSYHEPCDEDDKGYTREEVVHLLIKELARINMVLDNPSKVTFAAIKESHFHDL